MLGGCWTAVDRFLSLASDGYWFSTKLEDQYQLPP